MAKKSNMKLFSIILIVLGAGLVFYGFQMSGSFASKISVAVTGSDTDRVLAFYIGGAVSLLAGLYLFIKK